MKMLQNTIIHLHFEQNYQKKACFNRTDILPLLARLKQHNIKRETKSNIPSQKHETAQKFQDVLR